jgi:hydrogenase maturation protein HypF
VEQREREARQQQRVGVAEDSRSLKIHISGVVQGVGFRPFVFGLATRYELAGWVRNTSAGVDIEIEGTSAALDSFVAALTAETPPLARIESVTVAEIPPNGYTQFSIRHSESQPGAFQPISPDICICDDCLRELFDATDRRHRYPFINCTNCGPRFTIIRDIPYDRPQTTMAPFKMCPDCQAEYDDPLNRRFHAQPNACAVCGPQVELWIRDSESIHSRPSFERDDAVAVARALLAEGKTVAIKGLGGFHLACDAESDEAVTLLRERKGRVGRPFALMAFDVDTVASLCYLDERERALLVSRERPIVLLREREDSPISPLVAPGIRELGVMLPYTPLHYLLLEPGLSYKALVMTSGNHSEEPIATENDEALVRLSGLADAFMLHNRDIHARCDDSVTRIFEGAELPLRRSRGYAPYPVHLPFDLHQILAVGGDLKNAFCLTKERYAFVSQHIGDMENYETLRSFELMIEQLGRTFRISPEIVAHDLHPAYLSTRYALRESGDRILVPVQHHHAHVAACMAENGFDASHHVIGVAFDGTGYGTDGAIWGGEFLVANYAGFRRRAHLSYVPLPGGDTAIRKPYRTALAHLWAAGIPWEDTLAPVRAASPVERAVIARQIERGVNAVPTSSMGRLFDAVAALAGVRQDVTYEAQAAIELQMLVDDSEVTSAGAYEWELGTGQDGTEGAVIEIGAGSVIRGIVKDVQTGVPANAIAARFHNSVAVMVTQVCRAIRDETQLSDVALSGGVWQNATLLRKTLDLLRADGFTVHTHRVVPPSDGGLALGQAVVAHFQMDE